MITRCNRCGDESNSVPGMKCGRVDSGGDEPCGGTYHLTTMSAEDLLAALHKIDPTDRPFTEVRVVVSSFALPLVRVSGPAVGVAFNLIGEQPQEPTTTLHTTPRPLLVHSEPTPELWADLPAQRSLLPLLDEGHPDSPGVFDWAATNFGKEPS